MKTNRKKPLRFTLKPFVTSCPPEPKWDGGYAGGPGCNPHELADALFTERISGPWLASYMLRRFGWPNSGGDDYKEFMTWILTTPIEGLFLSVTPYMAQGEEWVKPRRWYGRYDYHNLHFAVRFTREIGRKLNDEPGRANYFKRLRAAKRRWWMTKGRKLYAWGLGKADENTKLVMKIADYDGKAKKWKGYCWGFWERNEQADKLKQRGDFLPADWKTGRVEMVIGYLLDEKHPEVKRPKWLKRDRKRRNQFQKKAQVALQRTMLDLLRSVNVRDVDFNIFGSTEWKERSYARRKHPVIEPAARFFAGAGFAPSYWFSKDKEAIEERKKAEGEYKPLHEREEEE